MTDRRKLLSITDYKSDQDINHDPTVAHLVRRLQKIREEVPVNYQLKKELKKRLFDQLKQMKNEPPKSSLSKLHLWWISGIALVIIVLIATFFINQDDSIKVGDIRKIGPFPAQSVLTDHPVSISPDGKMVALESESQVSLFDQSGEGYSLIKDDHPGQFLYPTWSNEGSWIAVVYQTAEAGEVWLLNQYGTGNRLVYVEQGVTLGQMSWSADDQWLAITQFTENGKQVMQVRIDGSTVQVSDKGNVEDVWPDIHRTVPLDQVKWPNDVREMMEQADQYWIDVTIKQQFMVLVTLVDQEIWITWMELRR